MELLAGIFSMLISSLLFAACLILPLLLTAGNLYNLCSTHPIREALIDRTTFFLGPLFMYFLCAIWSVPDWETPLYDHFEPFFHTPVASRHMPTLLVLFAWSLLSFWLLELRHGQLPPLPTLFSISGLEAGTVLSTVFILQLFPHLADGVFVFPDCLYMALFPLNYLLVAPRLLRKSIQLQLARIDRAPFEPDKTLLSFCRRLLSHSLGWFLAGFLLALPLLAILLGILVLFGQAPDAVVRAFTETSDWALSQKISPPPIEYDGHYLCTVAVGGHKQLVKPIRYGIRHEKRIVVNRQLCVANAFEQLIMERTPRLHRAVRHFYDVHGYPLSRKLTTPLRADITYILMKPMEWLFLLCLYTFDPKPENRIAMQYTGI